MDYLRNLVTSELPVSEFILSEAFETVRLTGAMAMDALHLTCARLLNADELITTENPGRPMYRDSRISVRYLGDLDWLATESRLWGAKRYTMCAYCSH